MSSSRPIIFLCVPIKNTLLTYYTVYPTRSIFFSTRKDSINFPRSRLPLLSTRPSLYGGCKTFITQRPYSAKWYYFNRSLIARRFLSRSSEFLRELETFHGNRHSCNIVQKCLSTDIVSAENASRKDVEATSHYLALIRPSIIFISRILESVKYVGELIENCKILFRCNRVIKIFRLFMFIAIIWNIYTKLCR